MIPLEISRRGDDAIKIYKHVLKKGKQKIPRCNLLILGEEHVGKIIDDNEVDIVDERSVTMGDEWDEKPKESQEEQISKTYIDGMSETLHAELPPEKVKKELYEPEPVLQEDEFMKMLEHVKMIDKCTCRLCLKLSGSGLIDSIVKVSPIGYSLIGAAVTYLTKFKPFGLMFFKWKHSLLKAASIVLFQLLLSGDVELNPGPGEGISSCNPLIFLYKI